MHTSIDFTWLETGLNSALPVRRTAGHTVELHDACLLEVADDALLFQWAGRELRFLHGDTDRYAMAVARVGVLSISAAAAALLLEGKTSTVANWGRMAFRPYAVSGLRRCDRADDDGLWGWVIGPDAGFVYAVPGVVPGGVHQVSHVDSHEAAAVAARDTIHRSFGKGVA